MLNKSDIEQIRTVVRDEVDTIVESKLKPIKKDLRYLKKTVSIIAKNYDEADVRLDRRVTRIEKHLHFRDKD